jgi:hypothetical protein
MSMEATSHLDRILDLIVVLGPIVLYIYKRLRQVEATIQATREVNEDHLPYIYQRLHHHDTCLNLDSPDHPSISRIPNGKH